MRNGRQRGFTLIELLLVMAIMGLMGTISIGGYRAMRRGLEEDGTMKNVNLFIRNAYQRAMIDRQPTAIYFWNETRRVDSDDGDTLLVVGHAVAVRRAGRVSYVDGNKKCIVDEFGDLGFYASTDSEGEEDENDTEAKQGMKTYIYKVNGDESSFKRYVASQATMAASAQDVLPMMTDATWADSHKNAEISAYGYYLADGVGDWKVGDAYGFEFADMTLPNNFIFETTYSTSVNDPIKTVSKVLKFSPSGSGASGQTITVCAIRPGKSGEPSAQKIKQTEAPDTQTSNR